MADIQRYLDEIESQHQGSPKYMATLTALLEKVDAAHQVMKDMPAAFDLSTAVGNQLDILGQIVGVDRRHSLIDIPGASELLDDESFRRASKAKSIQNQWNGTNERIVSIWKSAFGSTIKASWVDNQDMTIDLYLIGDIPLDLVRLIQRGYYIPRPMGVSMGIIVSSRDYAGTGKAWTATQIVGVSGKIQAKAINMSMEG